MTKIGLLIYKWKLIFICKNTIWFYSHLHFIGLHILQYIICILLVYNVYMPTCPNFSLSNWFIESFYWSILSLSLSVYCWLIFHHRPVTPSCAAESGRLKCSHELTSDTLLETALISDAEAILAPMSVDGDSSECITSPVIQIPTTATTVNTTVQPPIIPVQSLPFTSAVQPILLPISSLNAPVTLVGASTV